MSSGKNHKGKSLLFFCTRQNPSRFAELIESLFDGSDVTQIEVPCSARVGTGDLMKALASGNDSVAVLSCGDCSCVHKFGCSEAKIAMEKARSLARISGLDESRLEFIEVDQLAEIAD